jgi:hypothetical protein
VQQVAPTALQLSLLLEHATISAEIAAMANAASVLGFMSTSAG